MSIDCQLAAGSNITVLAPDVAELFPDSESVNEALRALVTIAQRQTKPSTKQNRINVTKAIPVQNK